MMKIMLPVLCIIAFSSPASAMEEMHHEAGIAAPAEPDAFAASREAMHKGMDVKPTGNVDADFVANMIPHHEGAVAMAKVELEKGKDPELRKLAEDIIAAQDKEIAFMKKWQETH